MTKKKEEKITLNLLIEHLRLDNTYLNLPRLTGLSSSVHSLFFFRRATGLFNTFLKKGGPKMNLNTLCKFKNLFRTFSNVFFICIDFLFKDLALVWDRPSVLF